jgi:hypothetical protein
MTIDSTDTIIILQRDGKYYKQEVQYAQEMHIRHEDVLLKTNIEHAIYRKDINKLQEYVCQFAAQDENMLPLIQDVFCKFKSIDKISQKFDSNTGKKSKSMYCKEVDVQSLIDTKLLIRLHDMYLWYKNVMEALEHRQHIKEIMTFMAS